MGNNSDYWDARLEDQGDGPAEPMHPIDRIVGLLKERGAPLTAQEIAKASGYQPGNIGLYVIRARQQGERITAERDGGETRYRLEAASPEADG